MCFIPLLIHTGCFVKTGCLSIILLKFPASVDSTPAAFAHSSVCALPGRFTSARAIDIAFQGKKCTFVPFTIVAFYSLKFMELETKYKPETVEDKWYSYWMEQGFFKGDAARGKAAGKEPYCIVIPPPNVTGVLHMGHMLNNTIQDVLVRRARMQGKEAVWVPGTDHASIATEAKVVAMLKEKGIEKNSLSREEFLKYAWEWKEKYGGIILQQLKKLGASCDWDRTRFTMEPSLSNAVLDVFVDLHKKGQIYRGIRMVNWDPQSRTALSDDEVIFKENNASLYYVKYRLADDSGNYISVATVRPETIMGDVAICVHPDDERYKHLVGKKCIVPLVNREVPIITDTYIDPTFGTGALKVTPAHDINDYTIGLKHNLPIIDVLNEDGTISEAAQVFVGMDRFKARKIAAKQLEEEGLIYKTEEIKNSIGTSERTGAVVEPRLSMQWFLKMDTISKPALEHVLDGTIKFHPDKFVNMYRHWMENVKDWCISRQLWWGHQIPAWYDEKGNCIVARTEEDARKEYETKFGHAPNHLKQDDDVLDTWFSSWLWPISVFDGFEDPENEDLNYFYPTNDLVTAPEIIFFWVARMIMAGYEYKGNYPFRNVYYTGIVRDKIGRKMSKSLGNSPDPIDLIEKFGADAVRFGMLVCSPAGNDILFDEKYIEQGRNFSNKIWNAFRLVHGLPVQAIDTPETARLAVRWFEQKLHTVSAEIDALFAQYRISEALMAIYKLIWDDFCAWYLEMIKPAYGEPIDEITHQATVSFFKTILQLLHPVMPFITEELWHHFNNGKMEDCIMISRYQTAGKVTDEALLTEASYAFDLITQIRNQRSTRGLSPKETLALSVLQTGASYIKSFEPVVEKLANISPVTTVSAQPDGTHNILIKSASYFLHLPQSATQSDAETVEKELAYLQGFLQSVNAKLGNEKFMANAKPDLIEKEQQKKADAEAKIAALLRQKRN